jgi:hypothetical protein
MPDNLGPQTKHCPFCNLPLTDFEIELNHKWHKKCAKCHYCQHEVTHEMASECVSKAAEGDYILPPSQMLYHVPCHERALMEQFKNKEFPIVQEQLDILNRFLLTSREEIPLTLDALYPLLRNLQQAAANVSIAINRKKDKIKIRDVAAWRETTEIREQVNKEEKAKIEAKKIRLQSERADPKLRDRRKAIHGLMQAFGLSEQDASAMLDKKEAN